MSGWDQGRRKNGPRKPRQRAWVKPSRMSHGMCSDCICNRHDACADDACECIHHRDEVLIEQFRLRYRRRAYQARVAEKVA